MTGDNSLRSGALSNAQLEQFIRDGFIRIDNAFPREVAEQGCDITSMRRTAIAVRCHVSWRSRR